MAPVALRVIRCHHGAACALAHWLGLDTQASPFYNAYSGVIPCVLALVAIFLVIRSIRLEHRALRLEMQLIRAQLGADVIEGDEMSKIAKLLAWTKTPQGKRDIALIVAAGSALVDALKQFKAL